ncbi:MAG: M1 family metallopeptidase [Gemmatimonadota bacterium]|jgi:aminopeptidase N|nr:peptidase M1 [Gemmatimonadota bacterium]MDP7032216.1 M1 family metallopeptidase [Gemmatimonadota bacterium]
MPSFRSLPARLTAAVLFSALLFPSMLCATEAPADLITLRDALREHRLAEATAKTRAVSARISRRGTANQDLYDALHYDLELNLDPSSQTLTGTVTATVRVTGASIAEVDLDLSSGMSVASATAGGAAAAFAHGSDVVTVTLDRTYSTGESVVLSVTYLGNPAGGAFGWDSHSGQDMIWTLSEPYGARDWWPSKDQNTDKPDSVDIRITVPDHLTAVSNGTLVSDIDHGATRTFHWHSSYPIATYLVSLAIHPYTYFSDWYTPTPTDSMEVGFWVFADHYVAVQATYAKTVPMLGSFAAAYGEYPFLNEKYGHAEFNWGGGMEHQTVSSLGAWSEDLISHELAHQWWGDEVTCADFGHIWLNEGFATWSEAYWKETVDGAGTYRDYMDAAAYYGSGTIIVENPANFGSIFDVDLSYNKASWVVHMLRGVMDDTDFFAGLQLYRATYGGGSATTEQLRDVMESVSGVDLDAFFQQWIYGEYFPVYRPSWTHGGGTLDLVIEQVQTNTGLFTMPIDIRVITSADTLDFTVQNSAASEAYALAVPGTVEAVLVDPDRWILRQVQTEVTNPTFADGILLVNGVHWDTYSAEIRGAYQDSVFWGEHDITFWDTFAEPASGYPAILPTPAGHGAVPADLLGNYSAVIWVGNHYQGDLADWQETPVLSYLEAGGNVLLMSRRRRNAPH